LHRRWIGSSNCREKAMAKKKLTEAERAEWDAQRAQMRANAQRTRLPVNSAQWSATAVLVPQARQPELRARSLQKCLDCVFVIGDPYAAFGGPLRRRWLGAVDPLLSEAPDPTRR
jgi:hypothetical protein